MNGVRFIIAFSAHGWLVRVGAPEVVETPDGGA
jgi:hypothetical protein